MKALKPWLKQVNNLKESTLESPCVRNCCLDHDDYCLGCHRHLAEITGWRDFNDKKKQAVFAQCLLRAKRVNN